MADIERVEWPCVVILAVQSIVANDGAQHLMTIDQLVVKQPKTAAMSTGQFDFDVHVAANVAEFEIVGAPSEGALCRSVRGNGS